MKELTNLELLMEYMEQNQYFIGNDLLAKYNELLQKEKKEQLTLTDVVKSDSEQLFDFLEWFNNYCTVDIKPNKEDVELYLSK